MAERPPVARTETKLPAKSPKNAAGPSPDPQPWHALSEGDVLRRLRTSPEGLTRPEAGRRLTESGPNVLPEERRQGPLRRFLAQFANLLIYVLLLSTAVTAAIGHWLDAAVILGVVVINAIVGYLQEGRAERAIDAIRKMLSDKATVIRDGARMAVDAAELVPGDVVAIESGDRVPADLRLIYERRLLTQEAMLTGESLPVEKSDHPVDAGAPLGDRTCMAFSGTLVARGQARGVVVATALDTELGRVSAMLQRIASLRTPLVRKMDQFARNLAVVILAVSAATFAYGVAVHAAATDEMFLAAVSLAVSAIPEGLPAIMTITLALGVERMARRNTLIRHLPAVETLGSVTIICSDKTGTFTRNEMTVASVATARHLFQVTGTGLEPAGEFLLDGRKIHAGLRPLLRDLTRAAILCSDAHVGLVEGAWRVQGDPMEAALLVAGAKAGLDPDTLRRQNPRLDEIPFDSEHCFMATLHERGGGASVYVKGAPERILAMCARQQGPHKTEKLDTAYWSGRLTELSERGERVLAIALLPSRRRKGKLDFSDVEGGLTLLGLFGLIDPAREDAVKAVAECRAAGIRVKMITGDHKGTARAVARSLGLDNTRDVLTGNDLDRFSDEELSERAAAVDVFARTAPGHKLRLVAALQQNGEIVAMTGDGVNDAPALKKADVGVAMGINGTAAAREASQMILADDNFASIAAAVEEGRTVYDNIRKSILFILPTNGAECITVIGAIAFGTLLPVPPLQILWVNMVTTITLALAFGFEKAEADVMSRPPRAPTEPVLSAFLVWRIVFVSMIGAAAVFGMFLLLRRQGTDIETARTAAVTTLVLFEAFYLFNVRRLSGFALAGILSRAAGPAFIAVALVLLLQAAFVHLPASQMLFATRPLTPELWGWSVLASSSVFVIVEIEKVFLRVFQARSVSGTRPLPSSV